MRRDAGGHAVGLNFTIRYIFGIHGPDDVSFTASDIGWVVGHTIARRRGHHPLRGQARGHSRRVCLLARRRGVQGQHHVRHPDRPSRHQAAGPARRIRLRGLRSLRALFVAGERSEPTLISTYQDLLDRYGGPSPHVIDNWWSTEVGSPIMAPHLFHMLDGSIARRGAPRRSRMLLARACLRSSLGARENRCRVSTFMLWTTGAAR